MKHAALAVALSLALAAGAAQAALVTYAGSFLAEAPGATGSGTISMVHDTSAHTLNIEVSFEGLSGTTTTAHIHCCNLFPFTGTSGVAVGSFGGGSPNVIPGFPLGVTEGSYTHEVDLSLTGSYTAAFVASSGGTAAGAELRLMSNLGSGQAYFNIHSNRFPGGEIRAFVAPVRVPEPATWALVAGSLGGLGVAARRRSRT